MPFFHVHGMVSGMKIHRFIGNFDFTQSPLRITDERIVHQIRQVLRLKRGEQVTFVSENSAQATGIIHDIAKDSITVMIESVNTAVTKPRRLVTLYCALLKKDNFELVVQKATEVGVSTIVPVITSRTIKKGTRPVRLNTIAREAAEQSGRINIPLVFEPHTVEGMWQRIAEKKEAALFCDNDGKPFRDLTISEGPLAVVIGPEGGWSEEEKALAHHHGALITTVGSTTLRAETAAIIASYLAVNC